MTNLFRAAFVVARRDFAAIIFGRAFIFFLLGPLFPVALGAFGGMMGGHMAKDALEQQVAVAMAPADAARLKAAYDRLTGTLGDLHLPAINNVPPANARQAARLLDQKDSNIIAVLSGTLDCPELTARADDIDALRGDIALMVSAARAGTALPDTALATHVVDQSQAALQRARILTARAGQLVLFLLVMLLAGMVLSNLVEEKTNKVIEILAAAIPIDAIFLGKLGAMLGVALVGICIWGSAALVAYLLFIGPNVPLPMPAVGWPLFVLLGALYFSLAYCLLGSLFIGIGAQAGTVREVQTLSMPVTMGQVLVFFLASFTVDQMDSPMGVFAAIFPFSSPFAMLARAAQDAALWPHLLAIIWQLLWAAIIIRAGVLLFRRIVMKSGGGKGRKRRHLGAAARL